MFSSLFLLFSLVATKIFLAYFKSLSYLKTSYLVLIYLGDQNISAYTIGGYCYNTISRGYGALFRKDGNLHLI